MKKKLLDFWTLFPFPLRYRSRILIIRFYFNFHTPQNPLQRCFGQIYRQRWKDQQLVSYRAKVKRALFREQSISDFPSVYTAVINALHGTIVKPLLLRRSPLLSTRAFRSDFSNYGPFFE